MFDKSQIYEEEIRPLVLRLKTLCGAHNIPVLISCAVKDNGTETLYENEMLSVAQAGCELKEDKIAEMIKMMNGFIAVPEERPLEMDFEFDNAK